MASHPINPNNINLNWIQNQSIPTSNLNQIAQENNCPNKFETDNDYEQQYKINQNYYQPNPQVSSNIDNLQSWMDNKKIMNTLRSIKTCNSINYDDIKLLPSLFIDMQEALKKSNANVLELKETIKDKILNEKKLKSKLKEYEKEIKTWKDYLYQSKEKQGELKKTVENMKIENLQLTQNFNYTSSLQQKYESVINENKGLRRQNEELKQNVSSYEEDIEALRKMKTELESKNKKYKNAHGILQNELSNIEEHLEDVKAFQVEIKKLQSEMNKMKDIIRGLEQEKQGLKEDNLKYITAVKTMKSDWKTNWNEKIEWMTNLENIKSAHLQSKEKYESNLKLIEQLKQEKTAWNAKVNDLVNRLDNYTEWKDKYGALFKDYNTLLNENKEFQVQIEANKYNEDDLNKMKEKYETEIFDSKCESCIWKNNFIEIAKFKIWNYSESLNNDIEKIIAIDRNYIINAPNEIKEVSNKIINIFKHWIEKENYQTINLRQLKETVLALQDKNSYLKNKLSIEMLLRRKIHNRYMYLRGNLRIMCRIRPFLPTEIITKKSQLETFTITNDNIIVDKHVPNCAPLSFDYDYIFDQKASQSDVYEEVTLLIQSMIQGNNICIIAYGQTCTGKTYTIQGPDMSNPGVAMKASKELFELIEQDKTSSSIRLTLTIIEIYNEQIFNWLDESTPLWNMYENANGNLTIPDLHPITISSFTEADKLFKLASKFRHTSATDYNDRSSRSHCVFTFNMKKIAQDGKVTRSTLNILDWAGSERISKSKCDDEWIKKEAISINLSWHSWSTVLNAIVTKASHIPYRDSKWTHLLKESLNENFNILLIWHISPSMNDLCETVSTLQFGSRIAKICKHKTGKERIGLNHNHNLSS